MKENKTLYSAKTLACFFVICIHISFPDLLGILSLVFSRFTVPFFFMVAGYYSYYHSKEKTDTVLNKRIKKIIILTLICTAFYFLLNILKLFLTGSISNYITDLKIENLLKFLFFNWTTPIIGVGHLWYLYALVYDYFLLKFVNSKKLYKHSYIFSVVAIIIVYIVELINYHYRLGISEIYWRNWLFIGFPFIMLGHLFRKKEEMFKIEEKQFKLKSICILIAIIIMYILEAIFIKEILFIYINSLMIIFYIFFISVNKQNINFFYKIGKYDSGNIYIIHYAVILFFCYIHLISSNNNLLGYLLPFLVFFVSYILSLLYRSIINVLKIKKVSTLDNIESRG